MNKKAGKEGTSQEGKPGLKVENIRIKESEDLKKTFIENIGKRKNKEGYASKRIRA